MAHKTVAAANNTQIVRRVANVLIALSVATDHPAIVSEVITLSAPPKFATTPLRYTRPYQTKTATMRLARLEMKADVRVAAKVVVVDAGADVVPSAAPV